MHYWISIHEEERCLDVYDYSSQGEAMRAVEQHVASLNIGQDLIVNCTKGMP